MPAHQRIRAGIGRVVKTDQLEGHERDVAIVPFEPVAFEEPTDTGPYELVGRHGSLTAPEMLVPLLVARK